MEKGRRVSITEEERLSWPLLALKMKGGHEPSSMGSLYTWKYKEMILPLEVQKECSPGDRRLGFSPGTPVSHI